MKTLHWLPLPKYVTVLMTTVGLSACSSVNSQVDAGTDLTIQDVQADVLADQPEDLGLPRRYTMPSCDRPAGPFRPLSVRCQHFVDTDGRVVILHGINARIEGVFDVTFSDGRIPLEPIPPFTIEDARRMREIGFNFLRLPVNWSGIEPTESGGLDQAYLDRVQRVLDLCQQAGVWVLIDFHQDAYSKEIGEDGAPLWAISPPPTMLLQGPLEDLGARRASTQVLNAFATFFGSTAPGPQLRTRFASMASQVAMRFRTHPAVIGYEIYNEPIVANELDLIRLHEEVATAIRAADPDHLIAFEPNSVRNATDRGYVSQTPFAVSGGVYAPHIYTLAFGGSKQARQTFTRDSLRVSHQNAARETTGWQTPLLVTEWGYDPNGIRATEYFEFQGDLQDEFGESSAFWVWKENSQGAWGLFTFDAQNNQWIERANVRRAITRVRPEAIAGWPQVYGFDRMARRFTLRFEGSAAITQPSLIFVPAPEDFTANYVVQCDGMTVATTRNMQTGIVSVPCNGAGIHTITIEAN